MNQACKKTVCEVIFSHQDYTQPCFAVAPPPLPRPQSASCSIVDRQRAQTFGGIYEQLDRHCHPCLNTLQVAYHAEVHTYTSRPAITCPAKLPYQGWMHGHQQPTGRNTGPLALPPVDVHGAPEVVLVVGIHCLEHTRVVEVKSSRGALAALVHNVGCGLHTVAPVAHADAVTTPEDTGCNASGGGPANRRPRDAGVVPHVVCALQERRSMKCRKQGTQHGSGLTARHWQGPSKRACTALCVVCMCHRRIDMPWPADSLSSCTGARILCEVSYTRICLQCSGIALLSCILCCASSAGHAFLRLKQLGLSQC